MGEEPEGGCTAGNESSITLIRWREWLGIGGRRWKKAPDEEVRAAKALCDWLQLLIVPAILVAVTFA